MSRLKKFIHSLLSGYVVLVANIFYTLASVPLVFHYLGKPEFGLWATVTLIGGYMALIDLGMGGSVSRILIDHKDDRRNGAYGSVIKTGVLVGVVQGVLIVLAGVILSMLAGSLLHIQADLQREFLWLMIGQTVLLGILFAGRIFSYLLMAHQLPTVANYATVALFFVNLAAMWAGLAAGWGVYSFLIGQAVMTLGSITINAVCCVWLGLLPKSDEWGVITWERFRELFDFGRDIFIYSVGTQLINASQTILLTRLLGLEASAAWNVCTRAYAVLTQVIYRIFDNSAQALAEMMVRGEKETALPPLQTNCGFVREPGRGDGSHVCRVQQRVCRRLAEEQDCVAAGERFIARSVAGGLCEYARPHRLGGADEKISVHALHLLYRGTGVCGADARTLPIWRDNGNVGRFDYLHPVLEPVIWLIPHPSLFQLELAGTGALV